MQPFFIDYYQRIQELHQNIQWAISGLPHAALDWVPGNEMNSLNVLVVHLCGAGRFWIGDVVGQDPSNRDRASEFQQHGWKRYAWISYYKIPWRTHAGFLNSLRFKTWKLSEYRHAMSMITQLAGP